LLAAQLHTHGEFALVDQSRWVIGDTRGNNVDLTLSSDQELLRNTSAQFIRARCPLSVVREQIGDETGMPDGYLQAAGALGWFAMFVPEEYDGGSVSNQPVVESAAIAFERGRLLQPGPFVLSNVVAASIAEVGSKQQQVDHLPKVVAGDEVISWAITSSGGDWATPDVEVIVDGSDFVLNGEAGFVQDAHLAQWLLVTALDNRRPTQFIIPTSAPGITESSLECLDVTRRLSHVTLDDVRVSEAAVVGERTNAGAVVERQFQLALAMAIAETVGTMHELFQMTVDYAKSRIAFGRPIGSFQAVKHQLADMSLLVEASKAGAEAAIRAVQDRMLEAAEIVSLVKAFVGDASTDLAQGCLQVHGGIGYTWEHDLHLYYRRLASDLALFGDPVWHRERVCGLHGL
jgi:alkylation response protein AidB-like acyl-CoA dehydrogenase